MGYKELKVSERIHSPSRNVFLVMQTNGNLELYKNDTRAWTSGTAGNPGATARFQNDCNLVIYAANGARLWASNSIGKYGCGDNEGLTIQDDGNLCVKHFIRGSIDAYESLWCSGTAVSQATASVDAIV